MPAMIPSTIGLPERSASSPQTLAQIAPSIRLNATSRPLARPKATEATALPWQPQAPAAGGTAQQDEECAKAGAAKF
jgi:hypothetical protein